MKRFYLQLVHQWNLLKLWQSEIDDYGATVICSEANKELDRAVALCAHNRRKLLEARNAVKLSGYAIDKHDRIKFLGI